jgi:hypothetical protein
MSRIWEWGQCELNLKGLVYLIPTVLLVAAMWPFLWAFCSLHATFLNRYLTFLMSVNSWSLCYISVLILIASGMSLSVAATRDPDLAI